jgi:hypothetical protein
MSNSKKIFAVVHIISEYGTELKHRVLTQVKIAFNSGADGVFLTPGEVGINPSDILECYHYIRVSFPDEFIGINFMCDPLKISSLIPEKLNAIWIDRGIGSTINYEILQKIRTGIISNKQKILHFGGFFFKGNNQCIPTDELTLKNLAIESGKFMDVPTTSGLGTGMSMEVEQLQKIHKSMDGKSLAIASGVTCDNVGYYLPYIDYFIIGSGIEKDSCDLQTIEFYKSAGIQNPIEVGFLDGGKIYDLAQKIHSY